MFSFIVCECLWGCEVYALEGQWLTGFWPLPTEKYLSLGAVVLSRVSHVDAILQAAWVDLGRDQPGFLKNQHIRCVFSQSKGWMQFEQKPNAGERVGVEDKIKPGDLILVQVTKWPRGQKGYQVSADITWEGLFCTVRPCQARRVFKPTFKALATDGFDKALASARDLEVRFLERRWQTLKRRSTQQTQVGVLWHPHPATPLLIRRLSELRLGLDQQLLLNLPEACYEDFSMLQPLDARIQINRIQGRGLLREARYSTIDTQIQTGLASCIPLLDAAASLVIEQHEAMTTVDVNSGSSTASSNDARYCKQAINDAALSGVARQIRVRNLGGMIMVDWISLEPSRWRAWVSRIDAMFAVDACIRSVTHLHAKCMTLIERSALGPSLQPSLSETCPQCDGRGWQLAPSTHARRLLNDLSALVEQAASHAGCYLIHVHARVKCVLDDVYQSQLEQFMQHHMIQLRWNLHQNQLSDYNIGARTLD